jgi:hypothetical protein
LFSTRLQDAFGVECSTFVNAKLDEAILNLPIYAKKTTRNLFHFARTKEMQELKEYAKMRYAEGEKYLFGPQEENVQDRFRQKFRRFI